MSRTQDITVYFKDRVPLVIHGMTDSRITEGVLKVMIGSEAAYAFPLTSFLYTFTEWSA